MLTSIALAAVAAHAGGSGFGFGWIFFLFLIPLFWVLVIGIFAAIGRRRWARGGFGRGYYGHHGQFGGAARGAESTLAERFANGDIDEKEYRARLEVLRANNSFGTEAK